jgi:hypothetical protein
MVRGQAILQSKPIPLAFRELQLCDNGSSRILQNIVNCILPTPEDYPEPAEQLQLVQTQGPHTQMQGHMGAEP